MNGLCNFNVYPNINITKKVVQASIRVSEYVLFSHAILDVILLDENDECIGNNTFVIDTSNGFLEWGSDDKFLVEWVKNKIVQK